MAARRWLWALGRVVLFAIVWGALVAAVIFSLPKTKGPIFWALQESAILATLLVATAATRIFDREGSAFSFGLARAQALRRFLVGVLLGISWVLVTLLLLAACGSLHLTAASLSREWVIPAVALTVNALTQELLVRGYPWSVLERTFGARTALVGTSLVFAAMHFGAAKDQPMAWINVALAGAVFGLLRIRSAGLWAPLGIHATWNVLIGPVLRLTLSGHSAEAPVLSLSGPKWVSGGSFGIEASVATTLTALALVAFLAQNRSARSRDPNGRAAD
jgi:membrane protease YdiL (CAAX protease family)